VTTIRPILTYIKCKQNSLRTTLGMRRINAMTATSNPGKPGVLTHLFGQPSDFGRLPERVAISAWFAGSLIAWAMAISAGYELVKLIH
jgi:hypothetical protein